MFAVNPDRNPVGFDSDDNEGRGFMGEDYDCW
jgi:hypothetical protein